MKPATITKATLDDLEAKARSAIAEYEAAMPSGGGIIFDIHGSQGGARFGLPQMVGLHMALPTRVILGLVAAARPSITGSEGMTRFYLLGDPWIDRRDRGKTTAILFGSPDPHIAVHLADTNCITGCLRCEEDPQVHRRDAEWLVNVLNTFGEWPPAIQPSVKKGGAR